MFLTTDVFTTFDNLVEDVFNEAFSKRSNLGNMVQKASYPKMDVYHDDNNMIIEASVPGLNKDDIEISLEDSVLIIRGKTEKSTSKNNIIYLHKELHRSSFIRSIMIDKKIYDTDKILAEQTNGILKISIPKAQQLLKKEDAKKITIK